MKRTFILWLLASCCIVAACSGLKPSAKASVAPYSPWTFVHTHIKTTYVSAGAPAGAGDLGQTNTEARWYNDWTKHQCGVDLKGTRTIVLPGCDNLYYFALPCSDVGMDGNWDRAVIAKSPWKQSTPESSAFKNHWIAVTYGSKTVYAQWEDTGPYYQSDCDYVFGQKRPAQEGPEAINAEFSALDISPRAFADLTGGNLDIGEIQTSWVFVPDDQVPDGPWRQNVTTSGPDWG